MGEVKTTVVTIGAADDSGEGVDVCIPSRFLLLLSGVFVSLLTMIAGVGETMAICAYLVNGSVHAVNR